MAVKEYKNSVGNTRYKVVVDRRSKKFPGIRVRLKEVDFRCKEKARQVELKLVEEAAKKLNERENEGISFGSLVDAWELAARKNQLDRPISSGTLRDYLDVLHVHGAVWKDWPVRRINRPELRQVLSEVVASGKSKSVCQKFRSALNAVWIFGQNEKLIDRSLDLPTRGIILNLGKSEDKRPEILTLGEMKKFLRAAHNLGHEMFPIWMMAFHTGMRSGELFALLWTDIDWENKLIHVTKAYERVTRKIGPTKGRYWRDVALNSELELFLKELQLKSAGRKEVLPRVRSWERGEQARFTRELCKLAGIPSISFHATRACWTTELLRQGVAPISVMKMGGWSSLSRLEIYARLAGIDIKGATDGLNLFSAEDRRGESKVVRMASFSE